MEPQDMMDNESDPQSGLSTGQPSDAATPDKPERDQRAELGEATVRDLSNLLIALRSLIAGSESRGKSSSRNRNAKAMARGDYIRRTRIAQNMTRYALAAKIGESQQLIARIEYGEVTHSKALPKVLAALGIRPDT
jgi:ribosome-binding protein aMBF1 (putative translation factor)